MALTSMGVLTTGTASGAAAWEIRAGSAARIRVMEFGFFLAAATASQFGIGTPQAIGITPTSPVDFPMEDPADIAVSGECQSALAWGTGPTVPLKYFRRIGLPATVGVGVIWTWPKGLVIAASSSLVLWNLALNSVVNAYAVCDVT